MKGARDPLTLLRPLVFLFFVPALFSCFSPLGGGKGVLRIQLPGQAPRSAFADYAAVLQYRAACTGPGGNVSRDGENGSVISIDLEPGDWEITLTALHHGGPVGSSLPVPVSILAGETASLRIPVAVDFNEVILQSVLANGSAGVRTTDQLSLSFDRDIPGLTAADLVLTGSGVTKGNLVKTPNTTGRYELALTVSGEGTVSLALAKTGYYLSLASPSANQVMVHYYNPDPGPGPGPGPVPGASWPSDTQWASYYLTGLRQPEGTTLTMSITMAGMAALTLENADQADYQDLYDQIEQITGALGSPTDIPGYAMMGEFIYSGFSLILVWTAQEQQITLGIEPDTGGGSGGGGIGGGGSGVWPSEADLAAYGLSGLRQPAGTGVDFSGIVNSQLMIALNTVSAAVYEDLLSQLNAKGGMSLMSNEDNDQRMDMIMYGSYMAVLAWSKGDDELSLTVSPTGGGG